MSGFISEMSLQEFEKHLNRLVCNSMISCSRYLEGILVVSDPRVNKLGDVCIMSHCGSFA
jgi:hypothetical protein